MNELIIDELYEGLDFYEEEVIKNNEDKERFKVENIEQANWALRKIRAAQFKAKDIEELASKEIERIKTWKNRELEDIERGINFFEGLLVEYFIGEREKDSKFRLRTPYGQISSRKQQFKWNIENEKAIESLKAKGINHLIRTNISEEVEKAELKKSVKILNDVVSLDGKVIDTIKVENDVFLDLETGEVILSLKEMQDDSNYKYHRQAIVYNGQVIDGIEVIEQPEKIIIKVED